MIKFSDLLLEDIAPAEIEELDGTDEVKSYLSKLGVEYRLESTGENEVLIVGEPIRFIVEFEDKFPVVSKVKEFLREKSRPMEFYELMGIDWREYYTDLFWDNVGKISEYNELYHATKQENVNEILENGLEARNVTRIPTSKIRRPAVFAVKKIGYLTDEVYGSSIIKIDTLKMKSDGFTPDVGREKDWEKKDRANYLINELNLYIPVENIVRAGEPGTGSWRDTVVIYSDIPEDYVSVLNE